MSFLTLLIIFVAAPPLLAEANNQEPLTNDPNAYEWTIIVGDDLLNDPIALKILENIEISKQRIIELQQRLNEISEYEQFLENERKIAQEHLQKDLGQLEKELEYYSPRASYERFLFKVDPIYHDLFWHLFEYVEQKIISAQQSRDEHIQDGGSTLDAQKLFQNEAAITKEEMIFVVNEANIKYGFADEETQKLFDKKGKFMGRYTNLTSMNLDIDYSVIVEDNQDNSIVEDNHANSIVEDNQVNTVVEDNQDNTITPLTPNKIFEKCPIGSSHSPSCRLP